jgi:hypothetical protein
MNSSKRLIAKMAWVAALVSLLGASAFADSRHLYTSAWDRDRDDRGRHDNGRFHDDDDRGRGRGHEGRDDRHKVWFEGRVRSINHERDGYRVWLDRGSHPFFIPEERFRSFPVRVGVAIRVGGFLNPYGYFDVDDFGPIRGPVYTSGDVHGIVESIDYRRGTLVLRDDVSGSFVTAILHEGDYRLHDLRPGDYVSFYGAWTQRGVFDAFRLEYFRGGRY